MARGLPAKAAPSAWRKEVGYARMVAGLARFDMVGHAAAVAGLARHEEVGHATAVVGSARREEVGYATKGSLRCEWP